MTGTRRAALLLSRLDADTAGRMLEGMDPDTVAGIAAELSFLRSSGEDIDSASEEVLEEFCTRLARSGDDSSEEFLEGILSTALGEERTRKVLERVPELLESKDPFMAIRDAPVEALVRAISGESARVTALVLSELPHAKSKEMLPMLDPEVRAEAIRGMTSAERIGRETRRRVARVIRLRLESQDGAVAGDGEDSAGGEDPEAARTRQLRKVAVLLRSVETELRDSLLEGVSQNDEETAQKVRDLMVTWEDVAKVGERCLQEVLRQVNSKKLALALVGARESTVRRIRSNISERANAMLDEETGLLSSPKQEEIDEGREEILAALRDLNNQGELEFMEAE